MNNKKIKPPVIWKLLLSRFLSPYDETTAPGDLEEEFYLIAEESGPDQAKKWYRKQALKSIPDFLENLMNWSFSMFKNYFKIAFRNHYRNKGYTFINTVGLAVGMACCMLIMLWVIDELSYDEYHNKSDNICRVIAKVTTPDYISYQVAVPTPLAGVLKEEYPEIVKSTRYFVYNVSFRVKYKDKLYEPERFGAVDPSFFEIFDFKLLQGSLFDHNSGPHDLILTKNQAEMIFGDEDPIGKVMTSAGSDSWTVTGIIDDIPSNSHIQFDCLVSMKFWEDFGVQMESWANPIFHAYVLLHDESNNGAVSEKISNVIIEKAPELKTEIYLQPLSDVHLYSDFSFDVEGHGNIMYVYVFSALAGLILFIACMNFINLSTARSAGRAKEVGIRKAVGAFRKDVIRQFFFESILLSILSLVIAAIGVALFLPQFSIIAEKQFSIGMLLNYKVIIGVIAGSVITGVLSGIYPALYLSSFNPMNILKGKIKAGSKGAAFRKILVVVQYTITVFLIVGSLTVYDQLKFIREKDLGFDQEYIINFSSGISNFLSKWEPLKYELLQNPEITNATLVANLPTLMFNGVRNVDWEGKTADQEVLLHPKDVGYDFVKTFGMEIVEGRDFSKEFATDSGSAFIVNEAAVKAMGLTEPIGKSLSYRNRTGRIIGVVKDFHHSSLHSQIEPVALHIGHRYRVCLKISGNDVSQTIDFLQNKWKTINPDYPLKYSFFDETIDRFYKADRKIGAVFTYFTLLAIIIASLGLFGLTSYVTEQRTREIGVRKVLGASVPKIINLISKEFLVLILISILISSPAAWYFTSKWLDNFVYRTDMGVKIFLLAGSMILLITIITTGYRAVKSALANPVDSLRYE